MPQLKDSILFRPFSFREMARGFRDKHLSTPESRKALSRNIGHTLASAAFGAGFMFAVKALAVAAVTTAMGAPVAFTAAAAMAAGAPVAVLAGVTLAAGLGSGVLRNLKERKALKAQGKPVPKFFSRENRKAFFAKSNLITMGLSATGAALGGLFVLNMPSIVNAGSSLANAFNAHAADQVSQGSRFSSGLISHAPTSAPAPMVVVDAPSVSAVPAVSVDADPVSRIMADLESLKPAAAAPSPMPTPAAVVQAAAPVEADPLGKLIDKINTSEAAPAAVAEPYIRPPLAGADPEKLAAFMKGVDAQPELPSAPVAPEVVAAPVHAGADPEKLAAFMKDLPPAVEPAPVEVAAPAPAPVPAPAPEYVGQKVGECNLHERLSGFGIDDRTPSDSLKPTNIYNMDCSVAETAREGDYIDIKGEAEYHKTFSTRASIAWNKVSHLADHAKMWIAPQMEARLNDHFYSGLAKVQVVPSIKVMAP